MLKFTGTPLIETNSIEEYHVSQVHYEGIASQCQEMSDMKPDIGQFSGFDGGQGDHWLLLAGFIVIALLGLWLSVRWDQH